jgi:hypothetical protein
MRLNLACFQAIPRSKADLLASQIDNALARSRCEDEHPANSDLWTRHFSINQVEKGRRSFRARGKLQLGVSCDPALAYLVDGPVTLTGESR